MSWFRTGNLRFQLPQPFSSYNTSFSATAYGPSCPQQNITIPIPPGLPATTLAYLTNSTSASFPATGNTSEDCKSYLRCMYQRWAHSIIRPDYKRRCSRGCNSRIKPPRCDRKFIFYQYYCMWWNLSSGSTEEVTKPVVPTGLYAGTLEHMSILIVSQLQWICHCQYSNQPQCSCNLCEHELSVSFTQIS